MLRFLIFVFVATTYGNAATHQEFEDLVDTAISRHLPSVIRTKHLLYPEARIPSYRFTIEEEDIWQNDVEVRLTGGAVRGLDVMTSRLGRCFLPFERSGVSISTCDIDLSGLHVTYTAQTSNGEHIFARRKRIWVDVKVTSATISIVISATGNRTASLVSATVHPIELSTRYDRYLDLDESQSSEFTYDIELYTTSELSKIIVGTYWTALREAFLQNEL